MSTIDINTLSERLNLIKEDFNDPKKPFRYVMFDDFFSEEIANKILNEYPTIKDGEWNGKAYVQQVNKFQKTTFEENSILNKAFKDLNSKEFTNWLEKLTSINEIIGDEELFGGGLHQSTKGAFLNVHLDYNIHPKTKNHRRLNLLVYMNKDWKEEYEGHLELWDLTDGKKDLLEKISPIFNRCVIFETNEVSFHGHPTPLNTPKEINRKSLATYYYTKEKPKKGLENYRETYFVNTQGTKGVIKKIKSSLKTIVKRVTS